jgi:di/tricarboxylate transporter
MKAFITPLIYVTFLIPMTAITVSITMFLERVIDYQLDFVGFIEGALIIVIFGIPVFWLANCVLQRIEKRDRPTLHDHIRQSIFLYLIIIYCLSNWSVHGFSGSEEDFYFLLWSGSSLVGIVIHYLFLVRLKNSDYIK